MGSIGFQGRMSNFHNNNVQHEITNEIQRQNGPNCWTLGGLSCKLHTVWHFPDNFAVQLDKWHLLKFCQLPSRTPTMYWSLDPMLRIVSPPGIHHLCLIFPSIPAKPTPRRYKNLPFWSPKGRCADMPNMFHLFSVNHEPNGIWIRGKHPTSKPVMELCFFEKSNAHSRHAKFT